VRRLPVRGRDAAAGEIVAGDFGQPIPVEQAENLLFPMHDLFRRQSAQGVVGVHERHSQRVRQMLLKERKFDAVAVGQTEIFGAAE
jgi:hypothetical protein